ncbi:MAG: YncE family protein [Candidatus Cyclobacteriaceae bacterium M3_2C_046]
MTKTKFLTDLCLLLALCVVSSCNDSDPSPVTVNKYQEGLLIVNEGNFNDPDHYGTLAFYNSDSNKVYHDVVKTENAGAIIGASIMDLGIFQQKGYIVCNSPDKIDVVDLEQYELEVQSIVNNALVQPRQIAFFQDKAYVTCWGAWGENWTLPDAYVAVIDLVDYSLRKNIEVGDGAEGIIIWQDKVFVADSYGKTVTVIDAGTDQVTGTIEVVEGPNRFVLDKNDKIWLISNGSWDTSGALQRIDPVSLQVEETFEINGQSPNGKMVINPEGDELFFLTAEAWPGTTTNVYRHSVEADQWSEQAFVTGESFYGLGIHPYEAILYVGQSQNFQSNGKVLAFQLQNGSMINEFEAGVAPSEMVYIVQN